MKIIARQNPKLPPGGLSLFLHLLLKDALTSGGYTEQFEEEFARFIGTTHAILVSSARMGLFLALKFYDIADNDEVIVPSYTCPVVPGVIVAAGARPVFVDADPGTFNMSPRLVEECITGKTKAIVATHIDGAPCDIESILAIAARHNLRVIEDGAQALGAHYKGKKVGTFGDVSYFSFSAGKQINTKGGGVLCTNDDNAARFIRGQVDTYAPLRRWLVIKKFIFMYMVDFTMRSFLFPVFVYPLIMLSNFLGRDIINAAFEDTGHLKKFAARYQVRYCNLQAALGLMQLEGLDKDNALRVRHAAVFDAGLSAALQRQKQLPGAEPVDLYYSVVLPERSKIKRRLLRRGIDTQESWNVSCASLPLFEAYARACPVADRLATQALYLPNYPRLGDKDIRYIADTLNRLTR